MINALKNKTVIISYGNGYYISASINGSLSIRIFLYNSIPKGERYEKEISYFRYHGFDVCGIIVRMC